MLDPDVPPEAEGNTDGGVGVVHPAAEAAVAVPQWAAIVRIMTRFDFSGSGSPSSLPRTLGIICHDTPNLS